MSKFPINEAQLWECCGRKMMWQTRCKGCGAKHISQQKVKDALPRKRSNDLGSDKEEKVQQTEQYFKSNIKFNKQQHNGLTTT